MQQNIFIYVYIIYIISIQFCSYILLWDIVLTKLHFYSSGTNKFKRKTQEERFLLSQESKTINTNAHKKPNFKHIKQAIHHVGYEYVLKLTADYNWQYTGPDWRTHTAVFIEQCICILLISDWKLNWARPSLLYRYCKYKVMLSYVFL